MLPWLRLVGGTLLMPRLLYINMHCGYTDNRARVLWVLKNFSRSHGESEDVFAAFSLYRFCFCFFFEFCCLVFQRWWYLPAYSFFFFFLFSIAFLVWICFVDLCYVVCDINRVDCDDRGFIRIGRLRPWSDQSCTRLENPVCLSWENMCECEWNIDCFFVLLMFRRTRRFDIRAVISIFVATSKVIATEKRKRLSLYKAAIISLGDRWCANISQILVFFPK